MKLKLLFPVGMLMLSGCAQLVTKEYSPQRGGVVKYSTAWFLGEKNRAKALEEMQAHCAPGKPHITREDSRREGTGQVVTNGSTQGSSFSSTSTESQEENIYIHFKCSKSRQTARK
ncbi:hypothetical protein BDW_10705 [Bdellovibrio bacteriovorus W]|nr:hypothetical protein BDW_10705 [Bdellovibrio bacteriovorus W]